MMSMTTRDEIPKELIEAARRGAAGAIDQLVAQAWPHAFRIAYSIVRDRQLAEDAAQEACAVLYRKARQLREAGAFRVWFYRVVMRHARRLDRREAMARSTERGRLADVEVAGSVARLDVARALGKLSQVQRAVIVLSFYAGMTSIEIAEVLKIPAASVRFHRMRAKRVLEQMLDERASPVILMEAAVLV
jgi:RNA polymerase sigma-70 factor, ECF subfamily